MSDEIIHYGVRGMKWGKRKAQSAVSADKSLTDKATLNKAKIARQDAKADLDQARKNVKDPGNRKAVIGTSAAIGGVAGGVAGGIPGAAIGAGAGVAAAMYATSKRGRERALKRAEVDYKVAMDREKRIKEGGRSTVETLIDRSNVSVLDLMTAKNYEVKD